MSTVRWRGCGRGCGGGGEGRASADEFLALGFSEGFMTEDDDVTPPTNEVEEKEEQVEDERNGEEEEEEEDRKDEANEVDDDEMVEHDLFFSGAESNDRPDACMDVRPDVWPAERKGDELGLHVPKYRSIRF